MRARRLAVAPILATLTLILAGAGPQPATPATTPTRPPATKAASVTAPEPEHMVGELRTQTMESVTYFYMSAQTTHESIGKTIGELMPRVQAAAKDGQVRIQQALFRYHDAVPGTTWTLDVGFVVPDETEYVGPAKVVKLPPFVCGSVLLTGTFNHVSDAIGQLTTGIRGLGYELGGEYRELYLYFAGDQSKNNITILQFELREVK